MSNIEYGLEVKLRRLGMEKQGREGVPGFQEWEIHGMGRKRKKKGQK